MANLPDMVSAAGEQPEWPNAKDWWPKVRKALIVIGILLFAYYVWPGRYIYRNVGGGAIVRIDRFTGQGRVLDY